MALHRVMRDLALRSVSALALVLASSAHANDVPSPYAQLEVGIADLDHDLQLSIVGAPGARFALAASPQAGHRQTRFGTVCLDPRHTLVLANGLAVSGLTLDAAGRYTALMHVPARSHLLGFAPVFQGAVEDPRARFGVALSRSETRVIGNGSRGDFRGTPIGLFPGSTGLSGAVAGDVNGDGSNDLIVWDTSRMWLLLNDGTGGLVDGTSGATTGLPPMTRSPSRAALVDVDGDGDLDVVYAGNQAPPEDFRTHLLINDGHGLFTDGTDGTTTGTPLPGPTDARVFDILVTDFDGDRSPDVIVVGDWRIYLNDGHGRFRDVRGEPGRGWETRPALDAGYRGATGDFDGNGAIDFVTAFPGLPPHLYLNDGNAYFREGTNGPSTSLPAWPDPFGDIFNNFIVGDLDRDGDLDIMVMTNGGQTRTWINDGAANFVDETFIGPNGEPPRLPLRQTGSIGGVLVDVDRDGDLDLLQGNVNEQINDLYLNDGNGYFSDTRGSVAAGAPAVRNIEFWATAVDIDGDGDLDVIANGEWDFGHGFVRVAIFVNR